MTTDADNAQATTENVTPDYASMTKDQLFQELGKAFEAKDFKLMGKLSTLVAKAEAAEERAKKDALQAQLVEVTQTVRNTVMRALKPLIDGDKLEGAEGIWFSYDFGAKEEVGINPSCRLMKAGKRASGEGGGSSSYVAHPAKSADLLAEVGEHVMFKEATTVTIDKQEHQIPAGYTFKQAYDHSTNGGWRNRVRMALLKEAGKI